MARSSTSSATMNGGGAGCMAAEGGERGWTRRATGTDKGAGQRGGDAMQWAKRASARAQQWTVHSRVQETASEEGDDEWE